jgi:hypothetical protein
LKFADAGLYFVKCDSKGGLAERRSRACEAEERARIRRGRAENEETGTEPEQVGNSGLERMRHASFLDSSWSVDYKETRLVCVTSISGYRFPGPDHLDFI